MLPGLLTYFCIKNILFMDSISMLTPLAYLKELSAGYEKIHRIYKKHLGQSLTSTNPPSHKYVTIHIQQFVANQTLFEK